MLGPVTVDNRLPDDPRWSGWVVAGLLGLLSAVPGGGSLVSGIATEAIQRKQRERDLGWAAMTNARLSALEALRVPVDPEDEEFIAIFTRLQRAAAETADEEKRVILAQAAANSGSWSAIPYDVRAEYASLAADLLPVHIRVLVAMEHADQIDASTGGYLIPSADFPWLASEAGLAEVDALRVAASVEQRGLGFRGSGPADRPRTTDFGRGLLDYLRAPSLAAIPASETRSG